MPALCDSPRSWERESVIGSATDKSRTNCAWLSWSVRSSSGRICRTEAILPRELDGVPVDVVESGAFAV